MNVVERIRDRAKIEAIKKVLSQNPRDLLLFTLGINSALRVSDLLSLRIDGVVGEGGKPQKFLEIREKKTGKLKRFEINQSVRKALRRYLGESKARREDFLSSPERETTGPLPDSRLTGFCLPPQETLE